MPTAAWVALGEHLPPFFRDRLQRIIHGSPGLCLADIARELAQTWRGTIPCNSPSFLAALDGSACRSGIARAWWSGAGHPALPGSNPWYGIPLPSWHPAFDDIRDSILVVEAGPKQVSSSLGHALMNRNPYASVRFRQAAENLGTLLAILRTGDWEGFISLVEEEALSLHAMMMTARPGYLLMKEGTVAILHRIRQYRDDSAVRMAFTLDAGANVHLLYPGEEAAAVRRFIADELLPWLDGGRVIHDKMGERDETT
ncbi:MAG: hypothetical protein R2751_14130 [Bacteroidales bacterium]